MTPKILRTFLMVGLLLLVCSSVHAAIPLTMSAVLGLQTRPGTGLTVSPVLLELIPDLLNLDGVASVVWLPDARIIKRGQWGLHYRQATSSVQGVTVYTRRSGWADLAGGARLRLGAFRRATDLHAPLDVGVGVDYHYLRSVESPSTKYPFFTFWDMASRWRGAVSARVNFLPTRESAPQAELEWQHNLRRPPLDVLPNHLLVLRLGWRFRP